MLCLEADLPRAAHQASGWLEDPFIVAVVLRWARQEQGLSSTRTPVSRLENAWNGVGSTTEGTWRNWPGRRAAVRLCNLGAQKPLKAEGGVQAGGGKGTDRAGDRTARAHLLQSLQQRSEEHTSELQSRGHLVC